MAKSKAEPTDYRQKLLEGQPTVPEASSSAPPPPTPVTSEPEPVETPEAPEVTPPPEPAEVSEAPGLVQQLQELGFENIEDDATAQQRLVEAYRQQRAEHERLTQERERYQPLAQYGQEYLALQRDEEFQQLMAARRARSTNSASAAPPAAERPAPWWNPPKVEQAWLERYREVDPDTQQPRWKASTPADVRASVEQYQHYVEDWADNLVKRPHEVLPPVIEAVVKPLLDRYFEDRYQEIEQRHFIDELREKNADWLYQRDPRTNQLTQQLSPEGQQLVDYANRLQAAGVTDPRQQWQLATEFLGSRLEREGAQVAATRESNTVKVEQAKAATQQRVAKATARPNRAGSVPRPTQEATREQNRGLRPGEKLLARMEMEGIGTT